METQISERLLTRVSSVESKIVSITNKLDVAIDAITSLTNTIQQKQPSTKRLFQQIPPPHSPISSNSSDAGGLPFFNGSFTKPKLQTTGSVGSLASSIFDKLEKRDSEQELHDFGDTTGWLKLYCDKRKSHFFFNKITNIVVWEAERLDAKTKDGGNWEKVSFLDHRGTLQSIFLDPKSGEVDTLEPVNRDAVVPKFDPGDYDPSRLSIKNGTTNSSGKDNDNPTLPSAVNEESTNPEITKKRKSVVESLRLVKHHHHRKVSPTEVVDYPENWKFMFDPHDSKRMAWDFAFILPCLLYLTVMMPFRLCFMADAYGTILIVETTMDMVFILDIFVNFRTGYFVEQTGHMEYSPTKVAVKYIKSWFVLDVVSGIPFALFENVEELGNLSAIKLLKMGRVVKAVRLVSFLKLTKVVKTTKLLSSSSEESLERVEDMLTDMTTRSVLSMLKIFAVISLVVHFMACGWVLIGRSEDINGHDNWLANDIYTSNGEGFTHKDTLRGPKVKTIYISAYYYCYTTITSVGYGDIHPYNDNERIYCVLLEALGGFMYAIIIAALTSIATSTDTNKRAVRERLDMVASYVNSKQFPDHLSRRIRRYFRHFFESKTAIDEQRILTDLPTGLRHEVSTYLISDLMSNVTLFKDLGPVSWSRILPLLRPCRFEAGDLICSQGEDCSESFILLEGECRAVTVVDPAVTSATLEAIGKLKTDLSTPRQNKSPIFSSAKHFSFTKISEDEPNAISALKKFAQEENAHFRVLKLGAMINVLCLVTVWEKSLETVVCTEEAECYAINSSEFRTIFNKDDETFKTMREKTVLTSFAMYQVQAGDSTDGVFDFGVPLYMFSDAEIEFRTEAYQSWKLAKKEHFAQALRKHESDKAMVLALKRARAVNRFARTFRSSSVGGPRSLKILPDFLKHAQNETSSSNDIQEENESSPSSTMFQRRSTSVSTPSVPFDPTDLGEGRGEVNNERQRSSKEDLDQTRVALLQDQQQLNKVTGQQSRKIINSKTPFEQKPPTSSLVVHHRLSPIPMERDSITSTDHSSLKERASMTRSSIDNQEVMNPNEEVKQEVVQDQALIEEGMGLNLVEMESTGFISERALTETTL